MGTEYNAELTFSPKLNEASLKLVEKAATKWRQRSSEYRKSRERALVAEANAAFTFHPTMNSRSQKIMTRRKKHYNTTKPSEVELSFENCDDDSPSTADSSYDQSVSPTSREVSFESASEHVKKEAETFIQEVISCQSDDTPSTINIPKLSPKSSPAPSPDDEKPVSYKASPRKIMSLPYNNADYLFKIKAAKEAALNAIRLKRTFTILGPYPYLRKSLCRRGWVEKFGEHSSQSIFGTPQPIRSRPKKKKKSNNNTHKTSSSDTDDSSSENDDSNPTNDPDFNRIVSRLLKDVSPTFIWTIKRDDIDFKYLHRDQMVNHYCKASSFTTKIGLCQHLRSLPWYDNCDPGDFFPRCYQLYNEDDRDDFKENFEMSASYSILKIYTMQYEDNNISNDNIKSTDSDSGKDDVPIEKADNFVPMDAINLALCHLKFVIKEHKNAFLDIEPEPKDFLTSFKKKSILNYSYSLTAKNFKFRDFNVETYDNAMGIIQEIEDLNLVQTNIEGCTNTWIMKPGAKSRGRGVIPQNNLDDVFKLADSCKEEKWVIQKYIELPLLVHNTKFDIRQWFMVTDWNPLTLYFYQDSYLRFGSKPFTLDDFDLSIHLCNNSVQKKYTNQAESTSSFAQGNMWTSMAFKKHLDKQGKLPYWNDVIYPGMKKAIQRVMMTIQDVIEDRKNSFELYGADFMLDSSYNPWLIEINCSPSMGGTTKVTERLCSEVLDDCLKVIIDKKENKNTSTGKWEIIYKQPIVSVPPYIGVQLAVDGKYMAKPNAIKKRTIRDPDDDPTKRSPRKEKQTLAHPDITPRKPPPPKQELKSSKIVGITIEDTICHSKDQTKPCNSIFCKHTEKYKKELCSSMSLNPPKKLDVDCFVESELPFSHPHVKPKSTLDSSSGTLPSIPSNESRTSPHLSTLSISPISSVQCEEKWSTKRNLQQKNTGRVSELIPTSINPYRLQQIISRQSKPKQLDMLALQNKYAHHGNINSVKLLDIKAKRRKMKKVSKIKALSKLSSCPHCDTKNQKGIILNLLKSPSESAGAPSTINKKDANISIQNQRPKKHFRVSLSQVSTISHKIVDIQQTGSNLKVVGEQTTN